MSCCIARCRIAPVSASRGCSRSARTAAAPTSTSNATSLFAIAPRHLSMSASFSGRPFSLMHGPSDVESITGGVITARTMPWLDAVPVAGRTFIPADGEPGAERVVLIRESLWHRRYSGDQALIGSQITINGQPRTVVGIMPDAFEFPNSCELWLPFDESTLGARRKPRRWCSAVLAVLKAGRVFEAATTEANALSRSCHRPRRPERRGAPARAFVHGGVRQADFTMSALVFVLVMVLMVVASNVATLVFARTWSRAPELAVRTALGAARTRVVGQLFFESLLLGSIAAPIGLFGAYTGPALHQGSFEGWPFWVTLDPNPRIIAFVVLLTLVVSAVRDCFRHCESRVTIFATPCRPGRGFAFGGFGRVGAVPPRRRDRALGGTAEWRRRDGPTFKQFWTMCRRCRRARC